MDERYCTQNRCKEAPLGQRQSVFPPYLVRRNSPWEVKDQPLVELVKLEMACERPQSVPDFDPRGREAMALFGC
jgi:hypothetical protein